MASRGSVACLRTRCLPSRAWHTGIYGRPPLEQVRCLCEAGYKGADCSIALNSTAGHRECAQRLCGGERRGRCSGDDSGPCVCNPGYAGADCTRLLCPRSCSGRGFCTDAGCQCYTGYAGRDCGRTACPGEYEGQTLACSGHGRCDAGRCQCHAGWADADCSIPSHPGRGVADVGTV